MLISITDIIVQSVNLYRHNAKRFIAYSFLIFIPGAFTTIFAAILPIFIPSKLSFGIVGVSYIVYVLIAFTLTFVSFWFSITFIRVLAKSYAGTAIKSMGAELHDAKVVFWPALGVSILTALAVFGGMLLLIVPGIIFGLWFAFSLYVTAIDHKSPMEAMKRSKEMVDGRWWSILWRLLLPSLVFGIIIVVLQYIIETPLAYILENTNIQSLLFVTWTVIAQLIISLVALLLAPFTTAIPTILYIELKKHPLAKEIQPKA